MIGQICSFLRTWGKEFIIGGDFNCLPVTFLRANLTDSIDAQVVAPTGVGGTCKGQKGRTRVIDYFLVSSSLVSAVQGVAIIPKAGISPHSPVSVDFVPRLGATQVRKLMKAPKLPTKRVFGPIARTRSWGRMRHIAQWALWIALQSAGTCSTEYLDYGFSQFFDQASDELLAATDSPVTAKGKRGKLIQCSWKPLIEPSSVRSNGASVEQIAEEQHARHGCDIA